MADTTDVAQPTDDPGTTQPASPRHQSSRLNQALAWVGIVAGGVFIVAALFLSGVFLNWSEHAPMRMGMGDEATAPASKDGGSDMKRGEMKPGERKPGEMKPGAMGREMRGPEMMGPH